MVQLLCIQLLHNNFKCRLPQWANIVQVINFGWQVCDILVGLLMNTAPGERLKALLTKFGGIGTRVKAVYDVCIVIFCSSFNGSKFVASYIWLFF